ncbi:hypothetical protein [Faecalibaculum rodentium]|uniref:hypothetical protein n=1 Tax=Faecalibaculum rodentium TaxID=1702221 RepID=UPI0023F50AA6|nr:hypothetical protein [Faecalibaculum rodentium]
MRKAEAVAELHRSGCVYATSSIPMYILNNRKVKRIETEDEVEYVFDYMEPYFRYPAEYDGFETRETALDIYGPEEIGLADRLRKRRWTV